MNSLITILALAAMTALSSGIVAAPVLPITVNSLKKAWDAARTAREAGYANVPSNKAGALAWGEASWLDNALSMYEATGEIQYLDYFLKRAKQVMDLRDTVTKTPDWTGHCQPAWTANGHYTSGQLSLYDTAGKLALVLETNARSHNNSTTVSLKGLGSGTYNITASNPVNEIEESLTLKTSLKSVQELNSVSKLIKLHPKSWPADNKMLRDVEPTIPPTQHMLFGVHTGMIAGPLARFASIVKKQQLKQYNADAAKLAQAARVALLAHESEFREEKGAGWYVFTYGEPMWCDGCPVPQNYFCAIGRAFVHLYRYDPQPMYHDRIKKLASTLKSGMKLEADGCYIWHYWTEQMVKGWENNAIKSSRLSRSEPRMNIEDSSHGAIDVEFACMANSEGIVFTKADLELLANTLTKRMLRTDGKLNKFVDGSGEPRQFSSPWLGLVKTNPDLPRKLKGHVGDLGWLSLYPVYR